MSRGSRPTERDDLAGLSREELLEQVRRRRDELAERVAVIDGVATLERAIEIAAGLTENLREWAGESFDC